jgi:hypothetical protein
MTAIGSPARTWHEMFTTFWASQAVSQVVSQSATVTVPLLAITYLGAASEQVGVITFLQYAPVLLITPVLGRSCSRRTSHGGSSTPSAQFCSPSDR